nr:hypothetical protein CFP56_59641 [Quercus suber]
MRAYSLVWAQRFTRVVMRQAGLLDRKIGPNVSGDGLITRDLIPGVLHPTSPHLSLHQCFELLTPYPRRCLLHCNLQNLLLSNSLRSVYKRTSTIRRYHGHVSPLYETISCKVHTSRCRLLPFVSGGRRVRRD